MKCHNPGCLNQPVTICECINTSKLFCKKCLSDHIVNDPGPHNNRNLGQTLNISDLLKKKLLTLSSQITSTSIKVTKTVKMLISILENINNTSNKILQMWNFELLELVDKLSRNPTSISQPFIKSVLSLTPEQARVTINDWDISEFTRDFETDLEAVSETLNDIPQLNQNLSSVFTKNNSTVYQRRSLEGPFEYSKLIDPNSPKLSSTQKIEYLRANSLKNPQRSSISSLLCSNKHKLTWNFSLSFRTFTKSPSFQTICKKCLQNFSMPSWNCSKCDYSICEPCGEKQGFLAPKLRCLKNHDLIWRPDSSFYYKTKKNRDFFTCFSCKTFQSSPSWHCRDCEVDLCIECGKKGNQDPLVICGKCKKSVEFQVKINVSSSENCEVCKRNSVENFIVCKNCKFSSCGNCWKEFKYSGAHPVLSCPEDLLLEWHRARTFDCNVCFEEKKEVHFRCRSCKFHVCVKCSGILILNVMKYGTKTHLGGKHQIVWTSHPYKSNDGTVACVLCNVTFLGGMFSCKFCKKNYCILCYSDEKKQKEYWND